MSWPLALLTGLATGVLSAFGVGGGTLLVLCLTLLAGMEQTAAQGINLLYFLPTSASSLPAHFKNGFVDKAAALPAILAGVPATALAAWAATGLDLELLRRLFGGYLLVIGLCELFGPGRPGQGQPPRRPGDRP